MTVLSNREVKIKSTITNTYRVVLPILLALILFQTWLAGYSRESDSGRTTYYYAYLADAFAHGNLHISMQPDPRLLAVDNPYDPAVRAELEKQGVVTPVDLSLYKGKFYLYWGPVPSTLLLLIQIIFQQPKPIADFFLALVFSVGTILAQSFLLTSIWRRYFPTLPAWTFYISLFLVGLIWPAALLRHENNHARIYEAAIAAGQFFLISGIWITYTAITKPSISNWRLVLAGSLWALAIGSRHLLLIPISCIVLLTTIWILRSQPGYAIKIGKLTCLTLPLAQGGTLLAGYNWARFGSITETGFSYQLAGVDLQNHSADLFSSSYIIKNLYNYLLNPPQVMFDFPFISMLKGSKSLGLHLYIDPRFYYAEPMTGLLYMFPFVIFAIVPLMIFMSNRYKVNPVQDDNQRSIDWITLTLGSSFILSFSLFTTYFWAGMRFAADFLPGLTMLSAIGFWQGYSKLRHELPAQNYYRIVGIILAVTSIVISTLLVASTL